MSSSCARFPNVYAVLLALSIVAASSPMAQGHSSWRGPAFGVLVFFPFLLLWGALVSGRGRVQPLMLLVGSLLSLGMLAKELEHADAAFGGILLRWAIGIAALVAFIHTLIAVTEASIRKSANAEQVAPRSVVG